MCEDVTERDWAAIDGLFESVAAGFEVDAEFTHRLPEFSDRFVHIAVVNFFFSISLSTDKCRLLQFNFDFRNVLGREKYSLCPLIFKKLHIIPIFIHVGLLE